MHKSYGLVFLCSSLSVQAGQITTDGSVGAAMNLTGPNYTIPQSLGTTVGNNLFQSFGNFSLSQGDIATFTGASSLQNVISRVTGGTVSNIDGTLRSQVGNANFFFINPAGVIFGKNAKVDVPSGFYVSTAQELRFSDGTKYSATLPNGSLTSAPPEAFGFLGKTGDIQIENGNLVFKEGTNVTFAGGSVTSTNSNLTIPRGNLRVYGQGDSIGAVPISGDLPVGNGSITVNGGKWEVSGNGGGNLDISGGAVNISGGATIYNENSGEQGATGKIKIEANTLYSQNSLIRSEANSTGNASNIIINVINNMTGDGNGIGSLTDSNGHSGDIIIHVGGNMLFIDGATVWTISEGNGNGGNIYINVNGDIKFDKDSYNGIDSFTSFKGNAGDINVNVNGNVQIFGGYISSTVTDSKAQGISGCVNINASNLILSGHESRISSVNYGMSINHNGSPIIINVLGEIQLLNGGSIKSNDGSEFINGGDITINAGKLTIDGKNSVYSTGIFSENSDFGSALPGNITINVNGEMKILNRGEISTDTSNSSAAGHITVTAGSLIIDANNSSIGKFRTGIFSEQSLNDGDGNTGNIDIKIDGAMQILDGGQISTNVYRGYFNKNDNPGHITLFSGNLLIDGGTISSTSFNGVKNAGNITINVADFFKIIDNGKISTETHSYGNAGIITINIAGLMQILDGEVSSSTFSKGNAGTVTVNAATLTIEGKMLFSEISSASKYGSTGNGGNIFINVGHLIVNNYGYISTDTEGTGKGGNIIITVANEIQIWNGSITSTTDGIGNGGNITINAGKLIIDQGNRNGISSETMGNGNAGNVTITVSGEMQILTGLISSSTFSKGNAGIITVNAGKLIIDNSAAILSVSEANEKSSGDAGSVTVNVAGEIQILNRGQISTSTDEQGNAGTVTVNAGKLIINGGGHWAGIFSDTFGTGNAGNVTVTVAGEIQILNAGSISSDTWGGGNAGIVIVNANKLIIDGQGFTGAGEDFIDHQAKNLTGISSQAKLDSNLNSIGNAGTVTVTVAGEMFVLNGGEVTSGTFSSGNAGSVTVNAGSLMIDGYGLDMPVTGIASQATTTSTGNAGNTILNVLGEIQILNGGTVSSQNNGTGNAGKISISAGERLNVIDSLVNNSAKNGNGGGIEIHVPLVVMNNGQITTSVSGEKGNGGDITISGDYLVMDTGFVQANTTAHGAKGGNIYIDELGVIGNGNTVSLGGQERETYARNSSKNIIQAAAPDGVSGSVTLSSPNAASNGGFGMVSGNRAELTVPKNPCKYRKKASLRIKGRGGLPAKILDNVLSACNKS